MTSADLWAAWRLWMVVASAVVVVAAALLVTIWLTARGILEEATRALRAAEQIRDHTRAIWQLQTTNEVAEGLHDTVGDIERKVTALVEALHGGAPVAGRR